MQEMFNYCTNLTQIPLLDTSEVTNMQDMFYNCKKLTEIPKLNTSNVTNMKEMFCSSGIKTIPALDCGNVNNFLDATASCKDLTNLEGFINLGKAYTYQTEKYGWYTLKLSSCTQLTHDSLINVINNLYDLNLTYDVANGGTLYRQDLIIGSENKAKLTEEEIKIATDKGWDVT